MSVIENIEETETEEEREAFHIDSLGAANWALRKLRYYRKRAAEIKELHAQEQERIDAWAKREQEKLEPHLSYFENILTGWHMEQLAEDEKRKTISLPNGKLKSVAGKDVLIITDEDAFLQGAPPALVRVERKPDKTAALKWIKQTGEKLPGVELEQTPRSYRVEVDE